MNRHRLTVIVLVLAVVLAGCSGIGGSDDPTSTTTTTDAPSSTATQTSTAPTSSSTSAGTTTTTTATTTVAEWEPPKGPNTPIDDKIGDNNRIKSVTVVNKVQAKNGNGVSNFDVEIVANTSLPGVDPEPLVDGDPYFLVRINGERVARGGVRFQHDEGTYTVEIDKGAFQQFDSGMLEVEVLMLDKDKKTDDLYGRWTGTVQYSSE
ncbi:hypothetical protein [Haladaptatus caseinilyticus]|uniref:hypothetical protein n=1 Tax=Haladaptatus caseinilyticus TaxID=2993314 RepID=UPI00224ADBB6|nr:hypothetical protein [Haladaptatus caseinilyticus]